MKRSFQEPFKGIKSFSTLFDVFLHCCFYTSLTAMRPAVFPVLAKPLRYLPAGIKSIGFHIHLKRASVSLFLILKTNM